MAADTAPAEGAPAAGPPHPLRVRTVTLFLCLPADEAAWARELRAAGALLARAAAAYGAAGVARALQSPVNPAHACSSCLVLTAHSLQTAPCCAHAHKYTQATRFKPRASRRSPPTASSAPPAPASRRRRRALRR